MSRWNRRFIANNLNIAQILSDDVVEALFAYRLVQTAFRHVLTGLSAFTNFHYIN